MWVVSLLISMSAPAAVQDCIDLDAAHRRMTVPLVEAEREFARGGRVSLNDAYMSVLARDSLVFQAELGDGLQWWSAHFQGHVQRQWRPQMAAVSAGGDFGYTFGPVEITDRKRGTTATGTYLSVWQRDGSSGLDGRWRLLIDHWVTHAPERAGRYARCRSPGRSDVLIRREHPLRMEALKQAEEALTAASYLPDAWILRNGQPPRPGTGQCVLPTQRTRLARGGDMAYTAGSEADGRSVLRLWRFEKDAGWRIEVELCRLPAT